MPLRYPIPKISHFHFHLIWNRYFISLYSLFTSVYSIYQSVQKESEDKKIVEDWEGQPEADEKSIEELLEEYLNPQKAAENKAKEEAERKEEDAPKVLPTDENASEKEGSVREGKKISCTGA